VSATTPRVADSRDDTLTLVVFDWDGTLVDSTSAITDAMCLSAADLGLPVPTRERASHVIGLGLLEAIHHAVPQIQRAQVPAFVERYRHHFLKRDEYLMPFDGIPELLAELAATRVQLAVATGKSRAGLDRALVQTGWRRLFATTRCADEGAPKPDPWMLHDICEELDVEPARIVMIGDTTHDLRMAAAAGARSVAVTYGAHPVSELESCAPVAIVRSVAELRDWLMPRLGPA
jgi:phosphoglycolate phosphatase